MDNNDRPEFVQVLNGLAAIRRVDLTKEAYELWWQSMKDWPLDDFKDAAGYLLLNCQFMPTPYDFEQLRKKDEPSAHEAWANAMQHAEGPWRQGVLGDVLTDQVVAMVGGYRLLALTNTDKVGFLERRFIDSYKDFQDTNGVREALPNLTERPRIQNGSPVPIGEIAKASV